MARRRVVRYTFNVFEATGTELPKGADKSAMLDEAASFLREAVIESMDSQNSPVAGHGAFRKLSKDYAAKKRKMGGAPVPDLELSGDLKQAIKVFATGNRLTIEVTGDQGGKADGHCNHSGASELPLRRFIPDSDETFKRPILQGLARIIKNSGD